MHRISFKISHSFPTHKRKIKRPCFFPPLLCAFSFLFFFLPVFYFFFPCFYLFIYLFCCLWKFPPVSGNFHLFSVFELFIKISPEPRSHIRTFSAPLESYTVGNSSLHSSSPTLNLTNLNSDNFIYSCTLINNVLQCILKISEKVLCF